MLTRLSLLIGLLPRLITLDLLNDAGSKKRGEAATDALDLYLRLRFESSSRTAQAQRKPWESGSAR